MQKFVIVLAALAMTVMLASGAGAYALDLSSPQNYAVQSPSTASHVTLANSSKLSLSGDVWALFTLSTPFTVQSNSTLTFSYSSTELPEIAAIVFDTNTGYTENPDMSHGFCFGGTDGWANAGYVHPDAYSVGDGLVTYTFSLASVLGVGNTYNYIIFVNDDDKGGPTSNGYFCNAFLSATPIPGAIWLLGSGLVGLAGLRRKRNA